MAEYYIKRKSDFGFEIAKFNGDSQPENVYTLERRKDGSLRCDCPAGSFRRTCKHAAMVKSWIAKGEPTGATFTQETVS